MFIVLAVLVGNEIAGVVIETGEGVKHLSKVIIINNYWMRFL